MAKHIHIHLAPKRTADQFYMTPKGSVSAKSREDAAKKKDVPLESVFVASNGLHGCPARAKQYYKDVANKFVTKVDIRLPDDPALGNWSGKIMNRGTVVYKEGSGYRPWFHKGAFRLSLNPSNVQAETKDAGFGIDDIAIGGTVIYKDGGSFKKAKAASKSGMRVKLDNGKEIHVGDVVSTDASDWAKYQAKDAGFDRREYSPREWNRLQDKIKEVESKIKATKEPISKRELEQMLAKLKAEQGKYRTDDAPTRTATLKQNKGEKHKAGEKIEILEFRNGLYRVRFANGETDFIGASSFTENAATKDAGSVVIGKPNMLGDFVIKIDGRSFICTFDGKFYRSGMMRAASAEALAELISKKVK